MNIQSIRLQEDNSFIVTEVSGNTMSVPDDFDNRDRVLIQEWVDDGGVIAPYIAPLKSTIPLQNEMVQALWEKSRGNSVNFDNLDSKVGF